MTILVTLVSLVIINDLKITIIVHEIINLLLRFTSLSPCATSQANLNNLEIYRFTISP